jgi:hypothetical protein
MSELEDGVNGDEVEGGLDLRDGEEDVKEKKGGVYDEVVDRRRVCARFGNGNVEDLYRLCSVRRNAQAKCRGEVPLILPYRRTTALCGRQVQRLHRKISVLRPLSLRSGLTGKENGVRFSPEHRHRSSHLIAGGSSLLRKANSDEDVD